MKANVSIFLSPPHEKGGPEALKANVSFFLSAQHEKGGSLSIKNIFYAFFILTLQPKLCIEIPHRCLNDLNDKC